MVCYCNFCLNFTGLIAFLSFLNMGILKHEKCFKLCIYKHKYIVISMTILLDYDMNTCIDRDYIQIEHYLIQNTTCMKKII